MRDRQLDGLVLQLRQNVFYMAGCTTRGSDSRHETESQSAVLIAAADPNHPVMVTSALDVGLFVHHPTWIKDVRAYIPYILSPDLSLDFEAYKRFVPTVARRTDWGARAGERLADGYRSTCQVAMADLGLTKGRVGFDNLTFGNAVASEGVTVVDAYSTMKFIRQVKTAEEIRRLERAATLNAEAIQNSISSWSRGMTWYEMGHIYDLNAIALGGFVQREGGITLANDEDVEPVFHTVAEPEDFTIEEGMSLLLDCHGSLDLYRWDGGKTWVVSDRRAGTAALIQKACTEASVLILEGMKPGVSVHDVQRRGLEVFHKLAVPDPDRALVFFHGMGLDHTDVEIRGGSARPNWRFEENMTIATHVAYPGDFRERYYIEDVGRVTGSGGRSLYAWGLEPHYNG